MAEGILTLTDSDFDSKVIKAERPVLVDFWAEWCAPCRKVDPLLAEIATEMGAEICSDVGLPIYV
jgi:thioredoxin 1